MLSSEFNNEMGALIRRLGNRIMLEPGLKEEDERDLLQHIEDAIVVLSGLYISLSKKKAEK
jgi:hypothetical protein